MSGIFHFRLTKPVRIVSLLWLASTVGLFSILLISLIKSSGQLTPTMFRAWRIQYLPAKEEGKESDTERSDTTESYAEQLDTA
jgi:hypothetical protein